ncbi:MAG: DNA-deoxyinosine glycosylase [Bacteroides sp.]|nr:DNA-deoxyinosine glycosylase [Bacteroides sp.]
MDKKKKGRSCFTSKEIVKLRELIIQKCQAQSAEQKIIRKKLRDLKFYISDFTDEINTVEEFDNLIRLNFISISDNPTVSLNETVIKAPNIDISIKQSPAIPAMPQGLAPVVGEKPKVLILGSFPGEESLRKQQYYSNSGNRFWKIIYGLFECNQIANDYEGKISFLKEHGIAIWDVLSKAVRKGSLDANIESGHPNDIKEFLKTHPSIQIIAFNGDKAECAYNEYISPGVCNSGLKLIKLLSSSGANNQYSLNKMLENWGQIITK